MKKVMIIGGAGRMGLATAQILLKKGYSVIIAGRNEGKLKVLTDELGANCEYLSVDANRTEELKAALSQTSDLKHIVVSVSTRANASGINHTTVNEAKDAFQRFWISYNVLHQAAQFLDRDGSVTLISGSSAKIPLKGFGVWGTLHGSLNSLVKQAAIDIAPIRVNAISPGGIGMNPDRQLAEHYGSFEDIANMIAAVIENPAVTATIIDVDSGERQGTWNG